MDLSLESSLFLVHLAATGMMVGIIWFVQLVHYPLFARAGSDGFGWYASAHASWTVRVVGPTMLVEAGTGILLLRWLPPQLPILAAWVGLAAIVLIWASTFMVQVPYHKRLARGWDSSTHRGLMLSNWFRTLLWTARGVLVLWLLAMLLA